jgi:hypothetical protein
MVASLEEGGTGEAAGGGRVGDDVVERRLARC